MKNALRDLLLHALDSLRRIGTLDVPTPDFVIERTRSREHGDFACNVALLLAKTLGRKPREVAETIVAALPDNPRVERVEVAGPGFINFFLTGAAWQDEIRRVLREGGEVDWTVLEVDAFLRQSEQHCRRMTLRAAVPKDGIGHRSLG